MKALTNSVERMYDESAVFGIQRLKSRILKQISHEFRTPLTSIIGFAEVLEENVQIDEKERIEYASYIRNEGLRLTKLIDDLITLDSIEQGKTEFQFNDFEIQETIRYTLTLVADSAHNKFIRFFIEMPDKPVFIRFDREKIIQALFQLLHNAIRFTKPDGFVNLKLEETNNSVAISVRDNGPGIPAKDIPTLFKRFGKLYQPGEETHCNGVGLAIVKHIVDRHNGNVAVQSKVGEGSTFTVRIPILK